MYVERSQCETVNVVTDESVFGIVNAIVVDCSRYHSGWPVRRLPGTKPLQMLRDGCQQSLSTEERKQLMGMVSKYGDVLQDKPGVFFMFYFHVVCFKYSVIFFQLLWGVFKYCERFIKGRYCHIKATH